MAWRETKMSHLHFLPSVLFIPELPHLSLSFFIFFFYLRSVVSSLPSLLFAFLICVLSFPLAICFHSFCLCLMPFLTFLRRLFFYVSIQCFHCSFLHCFCLLSFFFTPLSRATYLSLQDGAVHPWPGLWGHSEKADPKAEGAHTEVYRYGSERTHLHHTKV